MNIKEQLFMQILNATRLLPSPFDQRNFTGGGRHNPSNSTNKPANSTANQYTNPHCFWTSIFVLISVSIIIIMLCECCKCCKRQEFGRNFESLKKCCGLFIIALLYLDLRLLLCKINFTWRLLNIQYFSLCILLCAIFNPRKDLLRYLALLIQVIYILLAIVWLLDTDQNKTRNIYIDEIYEVYLWIIFDILQGCCIHQKIREMKRYQEDYYYYQNYNYNNYNVPYNRPERQEPFLGDYDYPGYSDEYAYPRSPQQEESDHEHGSCLTDKEKNQLVADHKKRYADQPSQTTGNACPICLVEFMNTDQIVSLPCHETHMYHIHCIKDWLSRNPTCPVCASNIGKLLCQKCQLPEAELNL